MPTATTNAMQQQKCTQIESEPSVEDLIEEAIGLADRTLSEAIYYTRKSTNRDTPPSRFVPKFLTRTQIGDNHGLAYLLRSFASLKMSTIQLFLFCAGGTSVPELQSLKAWLDTIRQKKNFVPSSFFPLEISTLDWLYFLWEFLYVIRHAQTVLIVRLGGTTS